MIQKKTVAQFEISYHRFLDEAGKVEQTLPDFAGDIDHLHKLYRFMVETRIFDTKAIALQRTGKMGTYPSTLGQEAICVGIGAAMDDDDVLCPYYREYGAQFWRGVTMEDILLYWGGDERGSDFKGVARKDFPISVPIASQTLHAVGVATAFQCRGQKNVAVATVGDGGTSRGDFYESVNVAGAWNLPVVFVVNNNQWAISVPRAKQTKCETIAQKAIAGGIDALQVDGNDIIAVQQAVSESLEKARNGDGATVVEAITYRMCDHTTADDASRYRPEGELEAGKKTDPIMRLRNYMVSINAWDEAKEKALYQQAQEKVAKAVENYLNTPKRTPESMLEYIYQEIPKALQDQYEELKARGN